MRPLLYTLLLVLVACAPRSQDEPTANRPNVLLIVADDMGYNELGSWGSEINTPRLDALAYSGIRFTHFHAAPTCAPTRAMLMSGTSNHLAGIGSMNLKRAHDNGTEPDRDAPGFGLPGYEGHLSARVAALPEILRANGYHTYMAGKWDLGRALSDAHMPHARGFERSFALTTGTAVHLGFPDGNASSGIDRADPHPYQEDGTAVRTLPADFFSTGHYTDKLIEYIDADAGDGRPFFAWLAYTAPHSPIQVPDDWRDRYAGQYEEGYTAIRDRRFARAKELGIFPADLDLSAYVSAAPPWEALSDEEKRRQSRVMELYAAMVENMDYHVGRLIDYLEATDRLDNTVILFMSDNGAAGGAIPTPPNFTPDNSLENMGRFDSWLDYGRGWAEAATAPLRELKSTMAEGGVRVAAFISGPQIANRGAIDGEYLTVWDVAPTILEIAGVEGPVGSFEGRDVVPMLGASFWGRAQDDRAPVRAPGTAVGWELHGHRALVIGDWKALRPAATGEWSLFNLASDPGETTDLAALYPERLETLVDAWENFAAETGIAPIGP